MGLRAGLRIEAADGDDGAEPVIAADEHVQRRLLADIQRGGDGEPAPADALLPATASQGGEQVSLSSYFCIGSESLTMRVFLFTS